MKTAYDMDTGITEVPARLPSPPALPRDLATPYGSPRTLDELGEILRLAGATSVTITVKESGFDLTIRRSAPKVRGERSLALTAEVWVRKSLEQGVLAVLKKFTTGKTHVR